MNYEKAYKEALERMKSWARGEHPECFSEAKKAAEFIFPELKESEDEKIRKWIRKELESKYVVDNIVNNRMADKAFAWLEKQGEQKPIDEYVVPETPIKDSEVVTSRMKYIDDNLKPIAEFVLDYANWDLRKDEWNHPVATVPLFRVLDALVQNGKQYSEEHPLLEKQKTVGESLNISTTEECEKYHKAIDNCLDNNVVDNNTKPKFKVGDWVVFKNRHQSIYQVETIEDGYYILRHIHGGTVRLCVLHDEHLRLWTINDAEEGDVLAFDWTQDNGASHWQKIVIFKALNKDGIEGYGNTFKNGKLVLQEEVPHYSKTWTMTLQPATKEQRDFLYQNMKETFGNDLENLPEAFEMYKQTLRGNNCPWFWMEEEN